MIRINDRLSIPDAELRLTFSRSGGPGGQNVNKLATRVTLRFDLAGSAALSEAQKRRIAERLATRIGKDGALRIVAQEHRTQAANIEAARRRFADLLRRALKRRATRIPTSVPASERAKRLEEKRRRAVRKRGRSEPHAWDE
ncbi:MAG: aminoacyl-tRNA hydrolase [Planctomycetes bacterium]|nr:aminoacyl-tRNA hydrolase [Planctomycetota bacterium]